MSAADGYGLFKSYYRRGLQRCSFLLRWAMREPRNVERATVRVPRFFYVPNGYVELLSVLGIQAEKEKLVADDENFTQTESYRRSNY